MAYKKINNFSIFLFLALQLLLSQKLIRMSINLSISPRPLERSLTNGIGRTVLDSIRIIRAIRAFGKHLVHTDQKPFHKPEHYIKSFDSNHRTTFSWKADHSFLYAVKKWWTLILLQKCKFLKKRNLVYPAICCSLFANLRLLTAGVLRLAGC